MRIPSIAISQLPEEEREEAFHVSGLLARLSFYANQFEAAVRLVEFSDNKLQEKSRRATEYDRPCSKA